MEGAPLALPDLIFLSKATPSTSPPCSRIGRSDPRMMLLHSSLTASPSSTSYICTADYTLSRKVHARTGNPKFYSSEGAESPMPWRKLLIQKTSSRAQHKHGLQAHCQAAQQLPNLNCRAGGSSGGGSCLGCGSCGGLLFGPGPPPAAPRLQGRARLQAQTTACQCCSFPE